MEVNSDYISQPLMGNMVFYLHSTKSLSSSQSTQNNKQNKKLVCTNGYKQMALNFFPLFYRFLELMLSHLYKKCHDH